MNQTAMKIIECQSEEEILQNYEILQCLYPEQDYPHITQTNYAAMIPELIAQGYRQVIAIQDNQTLGIAGFSIVTRLYLGRTMRITDLVIQDSHRGTGIGSQLVDYIKQSAIQQQCRALVLDTGIQRKDAHRFYEREGFELYAHHYVQRL